MKRSRLRIMLKIAYPIALALLAVILMDQYWWQTGLMGVWVGLLLALFVVGLVLAFALRPRTQWDVHAPPRDTRTFSVHYRRNA